MVGDALMEVGIIPETEAPEFDWRTFLVDTEKFKRKFSSILKKIERDRIDKGLEVLTPASTIAFFDSHNHNVETMYSIITQPEKYMPRYPTWNKLCYRQRLTSDIMLKEAVNYRYIIEDEISKLRKNARLQLDDDFDVDCPINLQSLGRLKKYQRIDFRRRKITHEVSVAEVRKYERRKWIASYGEVDISDDLTCSPSNGKAAVPTSQGIIGCQQALQWAFSMFPAITILNTFSMIKEDQVTVTFDFMHLSIKIAIIRDGLALDKSLVLPSIFQVPAETPVTILEFKLLDDENYSSLKMEKGNQTYLNWAIRNEHYDSALAVADKIKDVNAIDTKGKTALHLACIVNNNKIVEKLLSLDADPDIFDWDNNSALHLAITRQHLDIVCTLIEHGANGRLKNKVCSVSLKN
jgi:hypothetical protein